MLVFAAPDIAWRLTAGGGWGGGMMVLSVVGWTP